MKKLTQRQKRVFEFLAEFIKRYGYPPTIREIGERFKILWPAARGHLRALEQKGLIRINPQKSRGIELKGIRQTEGFIVPVAGRVKAGKPSLAVEEIESHLLIDKSLFPASDAFSLRITGDSMTEAGIFDGDYVIVKPQDFIGNGEIGVALIGDEATVKRIYVKEKEVVLKPENRNMEPASYNPDDVKIIGRVIGVVRRL